MAEGISACMPMALRCVGDAIRLDSENRTKEAYCQYLSCIIYISQVLKDCAWDKDLRSVYNRDTAKLFQLLHQCQERALTIISTHASDPPTYQSCQTQTTKHLVPPTEGLQRRYSDSSLPDQQHLVSQTDLNMKVSKTTPPNIVLSNDKGLHLPSPPSSPHLIQDPLDSSLQIRQRTRSSDHLDKAYKENKQLILAYRTRIQKQVTGGRNQDVTSKNLSLLRRMSENLVIAEAREQALKKKILERQQRLQEETNRRFGSAVLSTKEEQEQRLVYTKILEFEQETVWPKHLREKLKLTPEDSQLIKEIITKIFRSSDHPLTQFLLQYQYHVYRKLAPLVKDVGFRRVSGGGKTGSGDCKRVFEEQRSDQRSITAKSGENEDSDLKEEGKSLGSVNGDESLIESVSESETKATLHVPKNINEGCADDAKECNENVKCDLSVSGGLDSQEGVSVLGNHTEVEKNGSRVDLKKLKALLEQESEVENSDGQNQNNKSSNAPNSLTGTSSEFDNYFRELEEDMLDWESSDSDDNQNELIMNNSDNILHLTNVEEKTDTDNQAEDDSQGDKIQAKVSPLHWTSFDPAKGSEGVEPVVSVEEHLLPALDETVANDQEINQVRKLKEDLETPQDTSSTEPECSPQTFSINPGDLQESIAEDPNCAVRAGTLGDTDRCQSNNADIFKTSEGGDVTLQTPGSLLPSGDNKELQTATTEEVRSQLKDILVDIRFFLEKLQKLLMLAYEQLDTPAGRDLCYSCVEFPFFRPLWPTLLAVLRQVNYDKELCLADVMTENIKKKPEDLGVPQRLCLDDQNALDATGNTYPYQMAVEELHRVVTFFCPLEKLECIVRTSRCICQCVEDYWEIQGKPRHSSHTAIGCDDLLPILSYVVVRSGMTQLISECDAMEEFIPEGYLMGEEGYCLTTLLTALAYLATLKP